MDSFALLAIPLFILLSAPIAASHASKDLYETLHKWLYKIPGGPSIANMVGCGIFPTLCGSSPATAAAIGGIMTVNLEIGLVTPPVGLNLYVVKNIAPDVPMSQVLLGVIPFVIIDLLVIVLLCIWPELAIWLPNKMIG